MLQAIQNTQTSLFVNTKSHTTVTPKISTTTSIRQGVTPSTMRMVGANSNMRLKASMGSSTKMMVGSNKNYQAFSSSNSIVAPSCKPVPASSQTNTKVLMTESMQMNVSQNKEASVIKKGSQFEPSKYINQQLASKKQNIAVEINIPEEPEFQVDGEIPDLTVEHIDTQFETGSQSWAQTYFKTSSQSWAQKQELRKNELESNHEYIEEQKIGMKAHQAFQFSLLKPVITYNPQQYVDYQKSEIPATKSILQQFDSQPNFGQLQSNVTLYVKTKSFPSVNTLENETILFGPGQQQIQKQYESGISKLNSIIEINNSDQFYNLLKSDKTSIVIFSTCKEMTMALPQLELTKTHADKKDVQFLSVNYSQCSDIFKDEGIIHFPSFRLYQKGVLKYETAGIGEIKTQELNEQLTRIMSQSQASQSGEEMKSAQVSISHNSKPFVSSCDQKQLGIQQS